MDDKDHKPEEQESEKKEQDNQEQNSNERDEYSFLQETIKDESKGHRKNFIYISKLVCKGLIFGLAAGLVFSVSKPWFDDMFHKDETPISISEEEAKEEENPEEEDTPEEPAETPQEQAEEVDRNITQLRTNAAKEVQKCLAEIRGYTEGEQWVEESYDNINSVTGIIMADDGSNLLIFAKISVSKNATSITAKFIDGKEYTANPVNQDATLGYGIYAVPKSELDETTSSQISIATFGNSSSVYKGQTAIVAGSPFGYAGAISFGVISHNTNEVNLTDGTYKIINTDIAAAENGTGVVANMSGEIIAIINQTLSSSESMNLVTGYAASDIVKKAELLVNGKSVPYVGMQGVSVNSDAVEDMPGGVYIKNVDQDSPAMAAGIQKGDIITEVDGKEVLSFRSIMDSIIDEEIGKSYKIKGYRLGAGNQYVDISFTVTTAAR